MLELEDLPPAQLADRRREEPGHVGTERRRERRRACEQEVAGEDRHDVAPACVDAGHAAPGLGFVDDVVVIERAEVDQLDGDRPGDRVVAGPGGGAARVGGAEREGGPDALSARLDQVRGHIGQEGISGTNRPAERFLDPDQIVGERGQLDGRCRGGGSSRACHATTLRSAREHSPTQDC